MIATINKGAGIRGALNYVFDQRHNPVLIGGTCAGLNPGEIAQEMGALRRLRVSLNRACFHSSLSLRPGEKLTDDQLSEAAKKYMEALGFAQGKGAGWVAVKHQDREHLHIHVVACRVLATGDVVDESWDFQKAEKMVRQLEKDYGLAPVESSSEAKRKAPTRGEIESGISDRLVLQKLIDSCIGADTMSGFIEQIEAAGVKVISNLASTGRVSGISFSAGNIWFKGSSLGKSYSFNGLQKRGVHYEQSRDLETIRGANSRAESYSDPHPGGSPKTGGGDRPRSDGPNHRISADPESQPPSAQERQGIDRANAQPAGGVRGAVAQPNDPDRGDGGADSWRGVGVRVDGLVTAVKPSIDITSRQVTALADATGCTLWDIFGADGSGGWNYDRNVTLNPEMIQRLWDANQHGADVMIKPAYGRGMDIVIADDMTAEAIFRARADGWSPVAVVETSPGRHHAWFRASKRLTDYQRKAAADYLVSVYGADKGAAKSRTSGRLAGFIHWGHTTSQSTTWTRLCEAPGGITAGLDSFIASLSQASPRPKPMTTIQKKQILGIALAKKIFAATVESSAAKYPDKSDSEHEWAGAAALAKKGLDQDALRTIIQDWYEDHARVTNRGYEKHKADDYADRTAYNAIDRFGPV